jgi:Ca2+-binding RTX toxin-like protein
MKKVNRNVLLVSIISLTIMSESSFSAVINGSDASDNNSYTFPEWRSQLDGTNSNDIINGFSGHDYLLGYDGNDSLFGGPGNDKLWGHAGNDTLEGGVDGRDKLWGGYGDDLYRIYDSLDRIYENSGEGYDTVATTVDFILPLNFEKIYMSPGPLLTEILINRVSGLSILFSGNCSLYTGPSPCRDLATLAIGNSDDNQIIGNGLNNEIFGGAGNDVLIGGNGDDVIRGGSGNDVLVSEKDHDSLFGDEGDDVLAAFVADGSWTSSGETDELTGGLGADLFVIGVSSRPGGILESRSYFTNLDPARERFPQYIGQASVTITDFDWQQGDKIEVFGDISDYTVEFEGVTGNLTGLIFWDGRDYGFGSRLLAGTVKNLATIYDLMPQYDFQ